MGRTYAALKHDEDLELIELPLGYVGGEAAVGKVFIETQTRVEPVKPQASERVQEPVPARKRKSQDIGDDGKDSSEENEVWYMASEATPKKLYRTSESNNSQ